MTQTDKMTKMLIKTKMENLKIKTNEKYQ